MALQHREQCSGTVYVISTGMAIHARGAFHTGFTGFVYVRLI